MSGVEVTDRSSVEAAHSLWVKGKDERKSFFAVTPTVTFPHNERLISSFEFNLACSCRVALTI